MTWTVLPSTRFAEHAAAWDALQARTSNTPFLESAFLLPLLQVFGTGRECVALHHGAQGLDAAALVQPVGKGMWQTFQPSQLPLGPWVAAASADSAALARLMLPALPGLALGLGLTQLDPRLTPRPGDTAWLGTLDYIDTSCIDITGPWDAYWEARGKNLRQNTRKQRNKLQTEGTEPQIETLDRPEQVAQALADYGRLESAGWKAGSGTAIEADNDQGRFYGQMLQNFCALGRGRIVRYRFADKVVSMDLCIDNGAVIVILKTTYDESYKGISPSTLMRQDEFRALFEEERFQRIEFYGKTMEWHTRWTDTPRTLDHATVYRWPVVRSLHERLRGRRQAQAPAAEEPAAAPAVSA